MYSLGFCLDNIKFINAVLCNLFNYFTMNLTIFTAINDLKLRTVISFSIINKHV